MAKAKPATNKDPMPSDAAAETRAAMEKLATEIRSIDDAMRRLESGPVKKRALLILLKDLSGVSIGDIERVLKSMSNLRAEYLKS
jgi:hypothetical protein